MAGAIPGAGGLPGEKRLELLQRPRTDAPNLEQVAGTPEGTVGRPMLDDRDGGQGADSRQPVPRGPTRRVGVDPLRPRGGELLFRLERERGGVPFGPWVPRPHARGELGHRRTWRMEEPLGGRGERPIETGPAGQPARDPHGGQRRRSPPLAWRPAVDRGKRHRGGRATIPMPTGDSREEARRWKAQRRSADSRAGDGERREEGPDRPRNDIAIGPR